MNPRTTNVNLLDVDGIAKRYANGRQALDAVSFQVEAGSVFGLLGKNGAGKTTLIKILCGLLQPTQGRLRVLGCDAMPLPRQVKRQIGVVSQDINLDHPLSVRQNLRFHCRYFSVPDRLAKHRIEEWIEVLGLHDYTDVPIHQLSGGNKRKVMIARAFVTEPRLLILDEPTAALDPIVRAVLWEKISAFASAGGTVVLSTHYFEEAEKLCHRVGLIHDGKLLALDGAGCLEQHFRSVTGLYGGDIVAEKQA
jgi:heme ABC exporter ATP-binding subunit CcmA